MKATKESFIKNFESTRTTPYNRVVGLTMFLINLIPAIAGIPVAIYGIVTVMLIPFVLIGGGIGYMLFFRYYKIFQDELSVEKVRSTWLITIIFNLVGLGLVFFATLNRLPFEEFLLRDFLVTICPAGFQLLMVLLGRTAIKDLDQHERSDPQDVDIA
ncbi:MAG: hypothetical protein AAGI38_00285 [Bacteroidota bacterium]